MGDSSACLVQSLSLPSPNSRDVKEGDSLRALTTSISFGRFMSETLDWEKWSSFTHNRHLEEAEKYSKPGSVAQKKAYFEAHYKKIAAKKAAALLEQGSATANDSFEPNMSNQICHGSEVQSEGCLDNSGLLLAVDANGHDLTAKQTELDVVLMERAEPDTEQLIMAENSVQVDPPNKLETVHNRSKIMSSQEKTPIKDTARMGGAGSSSKKKSVISSPKSSTNNQASKLRAPRKSTTPVQLSSENNGTPSSNKVARKSMEKKRASLKSLHMSINFASCVDDTRKTSPLFHKTGFSRLVKTFDKTSKDRSARQMPNRASVNGVSKHPSVTTQLENKSHLESSSSCGRKAQPPTVCSSFNLKCEERVAKRKEFFEKLEERLKAKEAEKLQLQEKAANDFKKIRQSINLKDKPVGSLHSETELLVNHMKKIPPTWPRSSKFGSPGIIQDTSSRHPGKSLAKTDCPKHVTVKNNLKPIHSINSLAKKNMHENASPNIQI